LVPTATASAFAQRFAALSDERLLEHFAGARGIRTPPPARA
jgi:hypothetical protein